MIGGSEMQALYTQAGNLQEEIDYLSECKDNASDIDYWNSADKYAEEVSLLEDDLERVILEIENFGGSYERS